MSKKKDYVNREFQGSVKNKGHWQGVHRLKETTKNLGSNRKRYTWETDWNTGTEKGVADQSDVAPGEKPEILERNTEWPTVN